MNDDKLTLLEARFAVLEREQATTLGVLSTTRAELKQVQGQQRRAGRRLKALCFVAVAAFLLGLTFGLSSPTIAQGSKAMGYTVKGPFTVLDKAGKIVMQVGENVNSRRGLVVLNASQDYVAGVYVSKTGHGLISARANNGAGVDIGIHDGNESGFISLERAGEKKLGRWGEDGLKLYGAKEDILADLGPGASEEVGKLWIFNKKKVMASITADNNGGDIGVQFPADNKGKGGGGSAFLRMDDKHQGYLRLMGGERKVTGEFGPYGLVVYNEQEKKAAFFGTATSGDGHWSVNNVQGDPMVQAGVVGADKGKVQCNPVGTMTPRPYPTFLLGGGGVRGR